MTSFAMQLGRSPLAERGHDLYETPACAIEALLRVEPLPHQIWEPACGRGAICCQAQLSCADAPLVFNTPHLPFEPSGNAPTMPDDMIERLEALELAALDFLAGKRGQLSFLDVLGELVAQNRPAREPTR